MARRGRRWIVAATVLALLLGLVPTAALAAAPGADAPGAPDIPPDAAPGSTIPGRYIVTLAPGADRGAMLRDARGLGARRHHAFGRALHGFVADMPDQAARRLARDPRVERVEADSVVTVARTVQSSPPWGLDRIDQRALPLSGSYVFDGDGDGDGGGVVVYVVDTGIRRSHGDFGGRVRAGHDVLGGDAGDDCNGHGTHVAATVGGSVHGAAKAVDLVPVRVLDCNGAGALSSVIAGLDWIVGAHPAGGAGVANLSLGGGASRTFDDAVRRVIAAGIPVVVAAGNSAVDACTVSPARVAEAITVAATDPSDRRADFSNFGPCVDLFAPGVGIPSAWHTSDTATQQLSGTSMAAPHTAGVAALLLATHRAATPAAVADLLVAQATTGVVTARGSGSPNRLLFSRDTTPPGRVAGLALTTGRGRATLTWTNPGDLDLAGIDVRVAEGATPPASRTAGSRVWSGLGTSATATKLKSGTDYSFSVFASDVVGNVSGRTSIRARGTHLSAAVSDSRVVLGSEVTISGRLTASATGDALSGRPVEVLVRRQGTSSWSRVATVSTSSTGQVRHRHEPRWNAEYMLRFPGRSPHLGTDSRQVGVAVRQRVTAQLSATTIPRGSRATLTGTVRPKYAGEIVNLQRRVDGAWRNVGRATLSSTGSYRFVLEPTRRGTYTYRVHRPAGANHAAGTSPTRTLTVS